MAILLSVSRSPSRLSAVVLQRNSPLQQADADPASINRSITDLPLESVASLDAPLIDELTKHFAHISSGKELDTNLLVSVLYILANTYVDRREGARSAPYRTVEPQKPVATAAHPRGFKGTRFKPPKPPAAARIECQVALCDPGACNALLADLSAYKEDAIAHCESTISKQYGKLRALEESAWTAENVRSLVNHSALAGSESGPGTQFDRLFFNRIKGASLKQTREFASLFRTLEILPPQDFLLVLELLYRCKRPESALHALNLLVHQLADCADIATCLLQSELLESDCLNLLTANDLAVLNDMKTESQRSFLLPFFDGLANGVSATYLIHGFSIAAQLRLRNSFENVQPAAIENTDNFDSIHARVKDSDRYWSSFPFWLWEAYQSVPGLDELLRRSCWMELDCNDLLNLLSTVINGSSCSNEHCTFICRTFDRFTSILVALKGAQRRYFIDKLNSLLGCEAKTLNLLLSRLIELSAANRGDLLEFWNAGFFEAVALNVTDEQFRLCLNLPSPTIKHLQDFYRTENHRVLLNRGCDSLFKNLPNFAIESLILFPVKFLRVARELGSLPEAVIRTVPGQVSEHEFFKLDWVTLSDHELVRYGTVCTQANLRDPVPAELRRHVTESAALSARKLDRLRTELIRNASLLKLEILEIAIAKALTAGRGVSPDDVRIRQALQLANSADGNKRAFNKFIRALIEGQTDYVWTHPLTQRWIKRNSTVNLQGLNELPELQDDLPDVGRLSIALERDPLEALRLGTALNTCLGTGGSCSYSSIANVLDVNKFVIFAKNHRGSIIARQLAAISEQGTLVCFDVYAAAKSDALLQLFWRFDRVLAEVLSVPIHSPEEDYSIELIIANEWWDDFACGVGNTSF